jgi:D-amino-acid dehydrogenase
MSSQYENDHPKNLPQILVNHPHHCHRAHAFSMNPSKHVFIIGGGVIGLCSAYYALQQGMRVTLWEREPERGDNCSLGNAGMVVPSHFIPLAAPGMLAKGLRWMFHPQSPFYIKPRLSPALMQWGWLFYRHANSRHVDACKQLLLDLNLQSRSLFAELAKESDFDFHQRGLLMLCKTQHGLDEEAQVAAMAHALGARAEVLDAAATAKMDPSITMNVAGSVWFPDDCHLNPNAFSAIMRERVRAAGGEICDGKALEKIEQQNGKVTAIHSKAERHAVDQLVIAGGSWSAEILRDLGIKLPLQAGKGYSLTLTKPKQLPQLCSIFCEAKVAITPMNGTLRFAGTMEVGDLSLKVNPQRVKGIIRSVQPYFPEFSEADFADVTPWAGLRPVSPDGMPYIGRAPEQQNVLIATGHAMMGLSLAPITGKIIADLLHQKHPGFPLDRLAMDRFS